MQRHDLYFDTETLPNLDPSVKQKMLENIEIPPIPEPPKTLKKEDTIAAWRENEFPKLMEKRDRQIEELKEKADEKFRKQALEAATGHMCCIAAAFDDDNVWGLHSQDGDEKLSVGEFVQKERARIKGFFKHIEGFLAQSAKKSLMEKQQKFVENGFGDPDQEITVTEDDIVPPRLIAYNAGFDVRFMWQRSIILNVNPPKWWPINARPWDTQAILDPMTLWFGHGKFGKMDHLCQTVGIPGKDGFDGSMVYDAFMNGEHQKIFEYCCDDVRKLRQLKKRLWLS